MAIFSPGRMERTSSRKRSSWPFSQMPPSMNRSVWSPSLQYAPTNQKTGTCPGSDAASSGLGGRVWSSPSAEEARAASQAS